MHMEIHFSPISSYRHLSVCDFFRCLYANFSMRIWILRFQGWQKQCRGFRWTMRPATPGTGMSSFFHIFASCIVQLDLWNGFCHPCNLKIRIFIEKLAYKHVSHAYLKKIYYYFPVLVPWNSILYCIIWGGGAKKNIYMHLFWMNFLYISIYLYWWWEYIYLIHLDT